MPRELIPRTTAISIGLERGKKGKYGSLELSNKKTLNLYTYTGEKKVADPNVVFKEYKYSDRQTTPPPKNSSSQIPNSVWPEHKVIKLTTPEKTVFCLNSSHKAECLCAIRDPLLLLRKSGISELELYIGTEKIPVPRDHILALTDNPSKTITSVIWKDPQGQIMEYHLPISAISFKD